MAQLAAAESRLAALEDSLRAGGGGPARGGARAAGPDLDRLKHAGLRDPEGEVLADLARHPELIPFPAVEGGTMRFYREQCRLVSSEWAYGYFEDGHISGHGLYEFKLGPGGRITWKRLAATLD